MNTRRMLGIALLVAGILGLVYKGFTYTKNTKEAKIGPLEFSLKDKEHVDVPMWLGVVAIVAGAGLLLSGKNS
ncbi:MAG: hypothetical protein ABI609_14480 [Acidobacteriota bacterium]